MKSVTLGLLVAVAGIFVLPLLSGCAASSPLSGTSWRLHSYGSPANPTPVIDDTTISLEFHPGGVLTGSSGCNVVEGRYETDGDALRIDYDTGPGLHCDMSAIVEQERMFLSILAGAERYRMERDALTIHTGSRVLVFTRR